MTDAAFTHDLLWAACGVVALVAVTWFSALLGLDVSRRTKQAQAEHMLFRLNDAVRDAVRAVNQCSGTTYGVRKRNGGVLTRPEQATLRRYATEHVEAYFGARGIQDIGMALGLSEVGDPQRISKAVRRMIETKVEAFVWVENRHGKG